MKMIFTLVTILMLSSAFAQEEQGCQGFYAAGIGHLFKGEADDFGNGKLIKPGKTGSDEIYTAKVKKAGKALTVDLTNTARGSKVALKEVKIGAGIEGMSIYSTADLKPSGDLPESVRTSPFGMYLIFVCKN